MVHTYAFIPKDVLYRISWQLVREYFAAKALLQTLKCLHSDDPDVEAAVEAMTGLSTEEQSMVEEDLRDIYDLSDEQAMLLIGQEAIFEGYDFAGTFASLGRPYDIAMWALIHHEELFAKVLRFRTADNLDGRFWRRRPALPALEPDTTPEARKRLSSRLSAYLVREEGRGHHCVVEYLRRSTGHLFIAYPEDYGETLLAYEGDDLVRRRIKPATDLLFFYSPEKGTVEAYSRGPRQRIESLQSIFAQAILNMTLPPMHGADRFYELAPLIDPDYAFNLDSGIESINIKSLHLTPRNGGKPVTIYPDGPPGLAVLIAAAQYLAIEPGEQSDKLPLAQMLVDHAKLQAFQRPFGKRRRGKSKTFHLSRYGCALDQEGFEGSIRTTLFRSGIERPQPEPSAIL